MCHPRLIGYLSPTVRTRAMWPVREPVDKGNSYDSKVAIVPGVNIRGNLRKEPAVVKGQKTKPISASKPLKQPVVKDVTPTKKSPQKLEVVKVDDRPRKHTRGASLRDLCQEDKQRVANLIKEIAKLSEEKEKTDVHLSTERGEYEARIHALLTDRNAILAERERIESQLIECQSLVTDYQKKILEQQDKIAESISEVFTPRKSPGVSPRERTEEEDEEEKFARDVVDRQRSKKTGKSPQQTNVNGHRDDGKYDDRHNNRDRHHSNHSRDRRRSPEPRCHDNHDAHDYRTEERRQRDNHDRYPGHRSNRRANSPRLHDDEQRYHDNHRHRSSRSPPPYHEYRFHSNERYCDNSFDEQEYQDIRDKYSRKLYEQNHNANNVIDDEKRTNRFQHLYTKPFFTERPFTQTLDRELEKQKSYESKPNEPEETKPEILFKPRPPLEEPVFSSTPWNPEDEVDRGRTPPDVFQPLIPEPTMTDFHHDNLDDRKFLTYYKNLTPVERKEHLMAQKEALLREQSRLREVLRQQERLLAQKQDQLRLQQEEQQRRLNLFAKTGHFPDNGPVITVTPKTKESPARRQQSPAPSHVSIACSPIKSIHTHDVTKGRDDVTRTPPKYVDVATEMTQQVRRSRSPTLARRSPAHSHNRSPRTSERSMSIVDIVDSMEDIRSTPPKRRPQPSLRTPPSPGRRPRTPHSSSGRPTSVVPESPVRGVDREESDVLDDIFFLNK